jgi:cytidylate kinase
LKLIPTLIHSQRIDPMSDSKLVIWAFAAIAALWLFITGHIHIRINRVENLRETDREEQSKRRKILHDGLAEHKKELTSFKETVYKDYPTKVDMEKMTERIIAAVKP